MRKVFLGFFLTGILLACNNSKTETEPLVKDVTDSKTPPQSEFADAKYTEWGKSMLEKFASGNIDEWMNIFAENAVYRFSGGDSLAGKKAIMDYWKGRWSTMIDSLKVSNDIWLPIKVNVPQKGPDMPGIWLLNWHQVDAKYKTGKKITFWVHTTFHYDKNDKVDRVIQYYDRAPIQAATMK